MLLRNSVIFGRMSLRSIGTKMPWRCYSSASQLQTIPLAYDLHLSPSEEFSSSQSIPAIILMHGVFVVNGL